MKTRHISIDGITIEVIFKQIKNVHLRVLPLTGQVRISAPLRTPLASLKAFALSKRGWINKQQQRLRQRVPETPHQFLNGEHHWLWGRRYTLTVVEVDQTPLIELVDRQMILRVRPGATIKKRHELVGRWYRLQMYQAIPPLLSKWEPLLGVHINTFFVRQMKTRWGSCNPATRSIRIGTELARKPEQCLEYVIVHEMAHLLERSHNDRFKKLMDQFLPKWRSCHALLNQPPISDTDLAG